jgi:hypothetical protein
MQQNFSSFAHIPILNHPRVANKARIETRMQEPRKIFDPPKSIYQQLSQMGLHVKIG